MTRPASERLKELHEAAGAYITADDLGHQAIRDANHFVDVMIECAPQLLAVVEVLERATWLAQSAYRWDHERVRPVLRQEGGRALAALDEVLR